MRDVQHWRRAAAATCVTLAPLGRANANCGAGALRAWSARFGTKLYALSFRFGLSLVFFPFLYNHSIFPKVCG